MSKIKNGGLDQYGAGAFEQQQFGIAGVERVNTTMTTVRRFQQLHVPSTLAQRPIYNGVSTKASPPFCHTAPEAEDPSSSLGRRYGPVGDLFASISNLRPFQTATSI